MSTPVGVGPTAAPAPARRSTYRPATVVDALRCEWTKVRTVRSTYWTLVIAAVLGIGLGALLSAVAANHYATDAGIRIGWNPTDHSLRSLLIAQLAFAILGVMVVTGEYSTGLIRTSLAAVPKRTRMMGSKALVLTAVALVAGEVISFVTFFVGQALLYGKAPSATIGDHNVLRAVVGAGLYLTLLALLGVAFGVLLRHAAAAIGSVVAILLVLPAIAQALPTSWSQPVEKFWPTNAGTQVAVVIRDSHTLPAWAGFGVFALFVAVVARGGVRAAGATGRLRAGRRGAAPVAGRPGESGARVGRAGESGAQLGWPGDSSPQASARRSPHGISYSSTACGPSALPGGRAHVPADPLAPGHAPGARHSQPRVRGAGDQWSDSAQSGRGRQS